MTYQGLPANVARRLNGIRPVVRPSAAAQYGQALVSRQNLSNVFADIYRRAQEQGLGGTSGTGVSGGSGALAGIQAGGASAADPRMGYAEQWWQGSGGLGNFPDLLRRLIGEAPERVPGRTLAEAYESGDLGGVWGGSPGLMSGIEAQREAEREGGFTPYGTTDTTAEDIIQREIERQLGEQQERSDMLRSAIAELQAEAYALEQKRQEALAAARDDIAAAYGEEIDKITRQIGAYQGDLERWQAAANETMARSREAFGRATDAAATITQEGLPLLQQSAGNARSAIIGGYEDELVDLGEELMNIDIDAASKQALVADVMELKDLALKETNAQGKSAQALLKAAEGVAATAARAAGAQDATQIKALEEAWSKQLTDAITGLMGQRGELEKAKEDAIKAAMDQINGEFDEYGRFEGQLDYASAVTDKAMDAWFASSGMDELERQAVEATFMDLINQGVRSEGELRTLMNQYLSENGEPMLDDASAEAVATMLTVFNDAMNSWSTRQEAQFANQDVTGGTLSQTGDRIRYRRAGEAPDNIANRNHPAYQQRAQFMTNMNGYILEAFDVSSAGQWRDTSVGGGGQRSSNSDHYSGGALDFSGSPEEIDRLFRWLQTQPWVSFAQIYTSGPAAGTLHVSGLLDGETHHANDGHDHGDVVGTYRASGGGSGGATSRAV